MSIHLYDTLAKHEVEFVPRVPGEVSMYTCGPTVYGRPHIGNYSSFLMADLLRRWLEVRGFKVTHVKNITDVGHLVADQDEGEDKIEKQAKAERIDPLAIAAKYTELYLKDEATLNLLEPAYRPRATETVSEMLSIIRTLLENHHAYETADGYYFDVRSFPKYGELSGNRIDSLDAGARISVNEEKHHPADFALWKKCVGPNSHHVLRWSFSSGERVHVEGEDASTGFPGWHIECSAMSKKFLGPQMDIHTGGEDNIFPHHECEIAQSESSGPSPFVGVWLHKRRIEIALDGELEGVKMSKSLGNVLSVDDILAQGFGAMDLRYYLLSVHYRTNLRFSWKGLEDAKKARRKITEWMKEIENYSTEFPVPSMEKNTSANDGGGVMRELEQTFDAAMDTDLGTPAALGALFELMTASRHETLSPDDLLFLKAFIVKVRHTFGCFDAELDQEIPEDIGMLVSERALARDRKDFAESDRLRDELAARGYEVRDGSEGQTVKKL